MRMAFGEPVGHALGQFGHRCRPRCRSGRAGAEPVQSGSDPPEGRPVVAVPVLDQQRRPGVGLEVAFALEPCRCLRLDEIDGNADVTVDNGVDDGNEIGTTDGVQRGQDAVFVDGDPFVRLFVGEVHLMTLTRIDTDWRVRSCATATVRPMVGALGVGW